MDKCKLIQSLQDELNLLNYSSKTIKNYSHCVHKYLIYLEGMGATIDYSEHHLKQFLLLKKSSGLSAQTINLYLNAIKFFYKKAFRLQEKIQIKFAKRHQSIPIILSRSEIK